MEKHKLDKKTKDEIKEIVVGRIRAGDDFKKTRKFLENSGIEYTGLKTTFYTWKNELQPEAARHDALQSMHDKREEKVNKPLLPTPKAWNKGKQKESDESVFASVINDAIFYFAPCPQKGLKVEDVQKINVGGAVVGLVSYYTNVNLNHPIIIFVTRSIMLVLKIRNMCYVIQEKYSELKEKAKGALPCQGGVHST